MDRLNVSDKLAMALFLLSFLCPSPDRLNISSEITGGKPHSYLEKDLDVKDHWKYSQCRYVGCYAKVTYMVYNQGPCPAVVVLEMSPDGSVWVSSEPTIVYPKRGQVLVPPCYLHYSRVAYRTVDKSKFSVLSIWLQAQA